MKKLSKRLISSFIVLALVVAMLPMSALGGTELNSVTLDLTACSEVKIVPVGATTDWTSGFGRTYKNLGWTAVDTATENKYKFTSNEIEDGARTIPFRVSKDSLNGQQLNFAIQDVPAGTTDVEITSVDETYFRYDLTIDNVYSPSDITVNVTLAAAPHTVTMPASSGNGYLGWQGLEPDNSLQPGENKIDASKSSINFSVTVSDAGYRPRARYLADSGLSDWVDGVKDDTQSSGLVYKFENFTVTDGCSVIIEGMAPRTVTVNTDTGYTAAPRVAKAAYNESFSVEITAAEGYKKPEVEAVGSSGGSLNDGQANDGGGKKYTYTIDNVTEDTILSIHGGKATYTINTENTMGEGFTFDGHGVTSVEHGASYTFDVIPKVGYNDPTVTVYMDGRGSVTPSQNGTAYTVNNVTGNLTITVAGADETTYTVTFPAIVDRTGYELYAQAPISMAAKSKIIAAQLSDSELIPYSSAKNGYTFYIKLKEGYDKTSPSVTVAGSPTIVSSQSTGVYKVTIGLDDLAKNPAVIVTATINTYSVKLGDVPEQGYDITVVTNSVEHGGTATVRVTAKAGYKVPTVKYSMGEVSERTITGAAGTYSITPVTGDVTIKVEGAALTLNITDETDNDTKNNYDLAQTGSLTDIRYNSNMTITITPHIGYRVVSLGVRASADSAGAYAPVAAVGPADPESGACGFTISGITEDMDIKVTLAKVTYTVHVKNSRAKDVTLTFNVDSKDGGYSTLQRQEYSGSYGTYNTEDGVITLNNSSGDLPTQNSEQNQYYTFDGWYYTDEADRKLESNLLELKHEDREIYLTVKWTVKWSDVFTPGVESTGSTSQAGSGKINWYVRSLFSKAAGIPELKNASIVACGILYAGSEIDGKNFANDIKGMAQSAAAYEEIHLREIRNKVFVAGFIGMDTPCTEDPQKWWRGVTDIPQGSTRHAMGWVVVKVDGEYMVLFSDDIQMEEQS